MLKKYALPYIKIFLSIWFFIFILSGCGGGGGSGSQGDQISPSAAENIPAQIEELQTEVPEILIVKVTAGILKTAYLPSMNLEEDDIYYSIDNNSTEGNITLLDEETGRYSYFCNRSIQDQKDSFRFKIMKNNTVLLEEEVYIEIIPLEVRINNIVQNDFSSNLPLVIIDTGDKLIPDEPKIKGCMTIIEPRDNNRSHLGSVPEYTGYMEIEVRGYSSQRFPKKQYSVDTETYDGEDEDISLLGMPKEHKWVLNAPYADKSLMRNYLAYHKTRDINESEYYAVRSKFVELLTRKENYYRYDGVYVLMEKIKRDKKRLDIKKMKEEYVSEPKISGGYILQQDRVKDEEIYIVGAKGENYLIEYPKVDKLNAEQLTYIEDHIDKFETALYSEEYNNTASDNYYMKWIDEEAFIVHILSREFFRDFDSWKRSEFFYKERSSPVAMGPVWDFNLGMGNSRIGYAGHVDGWDYAKNVSGLGSWVNRLMSDPTFREHIADKWNELRSTVWSDSNLTNFIQQTETLLTEAAERNFERWPVLGKKVFLERKACDEKGISIYCKTFESAVNEHLKVWLLERAKWIDSQFK